MSLELSPKAILAWFIGILLLCLSYAFFLSESLFTSVQIDQQQLFKEPSTLQHRFRQALKLEDALAIEMSSKDREILFRIVLPRNSDGGIKDSSAFFEDLKYNRLETESASVQYLKAHIDPRSTKTFPLESAQVCGRETSFLPLKEKKDLYSLLAAVHCPDLSFFFIASRFDSPVPLEASLHFLDDFLSHLKTVELLSSPSSQNPALKKG